MHSSWASFSNVILTMLQRLWNMLYNSEMLCQSEEEHEQFTPSTQQIIGFNQYDKNNLKNWVS